MTGYNQFQQQYHANNPWVGPKPDWKEHSAADREWDKLEKRGVVDKFRKPIPRPNPKW